ncbi:small VCP/p97-interacting protein, partial [Serratia sp. IR-2025]
MDKFSELSRPVRIHRDWNRASMCHCGKCDRWEMTIADADGVQTCASCYDAEWLSEWQNYAEAAEKRITELEAEGKVWESAALKHLERAEEAEKRLATPVRLPETYSPDPWMSPDPDGTWL